MFNIKKELSLSLLDYIKVFLFIVCCGFPSGELIPAKTYILILLGIISIPKCSDNYNINSIKECAFIIISILFVVFMHYYMFNFVDEVLLKVVILVIAGFITFLSMGERFIYAFFKIMYWLCLISLPFFLLVRLFDIIPNIDYLCKEGYKGFFLWNIRLNEIILGRNCGPFWEPGAFSGYIIITFCFFYNDLYDLWEKRKKECVVMGLALISTFSTQGYLTAFMLILFKYLSKLDRKRVIITIAFLIPSSFMLYKSLPFLHEKINEQLLLASSWEDNESLLSANRFSTTMVDLYNIKREPLWGNTSDLERLYGDFSTIMYTVNDNGSYGSGSGLSSYAASHGLILLLVWVLFSYRSLALFFDSKISAITILFVICFLGQGEQYINYILYQSIPFLKYVKNEDY